MFSQSIVEDDVFLDMPMSSQALYFHLCMNADDYGFVSPKRIMRMVGANNDDLQVLIAKRYVLPFDSGVVVIKHWKKSNTIQKDRLTPTTYQQELEQLTFNEWGAYTEKRQTRRTINKQLIESQQSKKLKGSNYENDNKMYTQIRLDKIRLVNTYVEVQKNIRLVYDFFIEQFNKNPNLYKLSKNRSLKIKARLNDAGDEMLMNAIRNTAKSGWHRGDNDRGWQADLDFIIKSYEQVEKLANMLNYERETTRKDLEKYA